jgi:hypothetical protein
VQAFAITDEFAFAHTHVDSIRHFDGFTNKSVRRHEHEHVQEQLLEHQTSDWVTVHAHDETFRPDFKAQETNDSVELSTIYPTHSVEESFESPRSSHVV